VTDILAERGFRFEKRPQLDFCLPVTPLGNNSVIDRI